MGVRVVRSASNTSQQGHTLGKWAANECVGPLIHRPWFEIPKRYVQGGGVVVGNFVLQMCA